MRSLFGKLSKHYYLLVVILISFFFLASPPALARMSTGSDNTGGGVGLYGIPVVKHLMEASKNNEVTLNTWYNGAKNGDSFFDIAFLAASNTVVNYSTGNGALMSLANYTDKLAFASPPVSTSYYLASLGKNLGIDIVPTAYAANGQGIGFGAFYSVLKLWRVMANIAYGLLAIVFVIIGFLIMFRSKLNSQAEITIQTALPRLVVTMILIAFSYPIAGLLVDFMYLIIYAFVGFLSSNNLINAGKTLQIIFTSDPFRATLMKGFAKNAAWNVGGGVNQGIKSLVGQTAGNLIGGLAGSATDILLWVLLAFFLLYITLHIFITMLKAYAEILLYVALAPVYILGNAFPGSSAFSSWLKTLIAKLLVFPVIIFHYIIVAILVDSQAWGATGNLYNQGISVGWSPPMFNFNTGTAGVKAILSIVSLGILYLAPKAAETTENLVKGQLNLDMNQAIGGAYQQVAQTPQNLYEKYKAKTFKSDLAKELKEQAKKG